MGQRFYVRCSAQPLDAEAASLIEEETSTLRSLSKSEYRISNHEYRMSKECILPIFIKIYKRLSEAKPPFDILRFDIRYSAVRCSARPPAARAASLIIKKPCHFGVVSYEVQDSWVQKLRRSGFRIEKFIIHDNSETVNAG
jgi:hypothetical protein